MGLAEDDPDTKARLFGLRQGLEKNLSAVPFNTPRTEGTMNRTILIAAIALLASTAAVAQAKRGERDPDKMAAIAATILVFDRDCEKVSPKIEEAAGVAVELAGKPKVVAAVMLIEDQIKRDGKGAWCTLARKAFPPLTER
jgi:hypothetical protein